MADEESEIRRMAEIADAINAILDADPVGETPAEGASSPRNPTPTTPSANPDTTPAAARADASVDDMADNMAPDMAGDLDAAIAAEMGAQNAPETSAAMPTEDAGDFGPVPDIDFGAVAPTNNEIGREVHPDSHMADLSLRMQDTLAEIRSGSLIHGSSNQEMLAQMEAARNGIVAAMREKIDQLNTETASRKKAIMEHLQQLESQNSLLRDEMEIQVLKFEDELKSIQQKYFENTVTDGDRLDRYREFLKYLLTERGTKLD
ncbi:hypothetical protein N9M29_05410 [Alphaproteobacteria bacterium]|nr:hypothetical protein [Alphaproteobacteria bacterium]MDB2626549.1 hypothetical protein [Alphaproteobacteria bacterium]